MKARFSRMWAGFAIVCGVVAAICLFAGFTAAAGWFTLAMLVSVTIGALLSWTKLGDHAAPLD